MAITPDSAGADAASFVLLGGPGAGKGSCARLVCKSLQLAHVSSGDILRRRISEGCYAGTPVPEQVRNGQLVDDSVIVDMIAAEVGPLPQDACLLFDGYPRTVQQAILLDQFMTERRGRIAGAILLDVPMARLIERALARRTCSNAACQKSYGINNPPRSAGRCDECCSLLMRRSDDAQPIVQARMDLSARILEPLCRYYDTTGRLSVIQVEPHMNSIATARLLAEVVRGHK